MNSPHLFPGKIITWTLAAAWALAGALRAQTPPPAFSQQQQFNQTSTPAPASGLTAAGTVDILGVANPDFGSGTILRRPPLPPEFELALDGSLKATSNAFFTKTDPRTDYIGVSHAGLSYRPQAVTAWEPALSATFGFDYDWYRYAKYNLLDFDSQALSASLNYCLATDWNLFGGWKGSRLVEAQHYTEIYKESDSFVGLSHDLWRQEKFLVTAAWTADWLPSSPAAFTRVSNHLSLQGFYFLRSDLYLSAQAAPSWDIYYEGNRQDLGAAVEIGAYYSPAAWLTLGASSSYNWNFSSQPSYNFQEGNLQARVLARINF